ncbi:Sec-independent protein translocase subunit TatA [Cumulibacter manganitolerans]|uniref:Sec-independent protein translocase subunit TatA n=1 Tax=Cumulibacter manganitolerans TaxID=1884992 RepID=UPI001295056F|nr:Sec-independent protein translocase subunit TatA [Cumulibacter manganitolerans]
MNLGPMEIAIIAILIFALFGYKKLPDATRAVGRSLRIFKGEMQGMKDDDVATRAEAQTVRAPIEPPARPVNQVPPAPGSAQPTPRPNQTPPTSAS